MHAKKRKWHKLYDSAETARKAVPLHGVIKVFINEKSVCLTRTEKGIFAFNEHCPHQGASILRGGHSNEKNQVVCPWHRFCFDLETGRGEGMYLPVYPVEEREDGVYIGFETGFMNFFA